MTKVEVQQGRHNCLTRTLTNLRDTLDDLRDKAQSLLLECTRESDKTHAMHREKSTLWKEVHLILASFVALLIVFQSLLGLSEPPTSRFALASERWVQSSV